MIACFYNKEDIGEVIHLEEVIRIELTEEKKSGELVYCIDLAFEPEKRMMLLYDEWRLLWADRRW